MRKFTPSLVLATALVGAVLALTTGVPAAADGCNDRVANRGFTSACGAMELAAQTKRPRVTIYRRYISPRPNAVRQCYSWLEREYRVSGPVIVPQMRCWWE
jgi:hypothetical protein